MKKLTFGFYMLSMFHFTPYLVLAACLISCGSSSQKDAAKDAADIKAAAYIESAERVHVAAHIDNLARAQGFQQEEDAGWNEQSLVATSDEVETKLSRKNLLLLDSLMGRVIQGVNKVNARIDKKNSDGSSLQLPRAGKITFKLSTKNTKSTSGGFAFSLLVDADASRKIGNVSFSTVSISCVPSQKEVILRNKIVEQDVHAIEATYKKQNRMLYDMPLKLDSIKKKYGEDPENQKAYEIAYDQWKAKKEKIIEQIDTLEFKFIDKSRLNSLRNLEAGIISEANRLIDGFAELKKKYPLSTQSSCLSLEVGYTVSVDTSVDSGIKLFVLKFTIGHTDSIETTNTVIIDFGPIKKDA